MVKYMYDRFSIQRGGNGQDWRGVSCRAHSDRFGENLAFDGGAVFQVLA